MYDYSEFVEVIEKRAAVDDNWYDGVTSCWKQMIEVFSADPEKTIGFLKDACTADEFSFLSEVFDQIAEKIQRRIFIDCLYDLARKYPEETEKYNILSFIKSAEEITDWYEKKSKELGVERFTNGGKSIICEGSIAEIEAWLRSK